MLESLHKSIRVLASQPGTNAGQIALLKHRFPSVPEEYLKLAQEATEIELQHDKGQYIRIWGPNGCLDMDDGYNISARIVGAVPIGDDGGGKVIFYMDGKCGHGLYHVGYGDLDAEDAVFIAPTLTAFLHQAAGFETF